MKRIPYFDDHWRYTTGDWFDCDPHTDYQKDPAWYAPDLIDAILNAETVHEIACHTFSHIDCSYKNCPPDVLEDELKASFDAAKKWGVEFKSITFPGGTAGNYETLQKYGIKICRRRHLDYELAYPFYNDEGMIVSPTGPCVAIVYPHWSMDYRFSRLKKAVDKAIQTNTIAHFWFHPSQEEETFHELLPMILRYCAEKRDDGELWVGTMSEIADHIETTR
jgi:peptidoglycan/xylan/chitin deacetylase (PgdA/CDA1 family)